MNIYIIIEQSIYYPAGDNSDWKEVFRGTTDAGARQRFAAYAAGREDRLGRWSWTSLIRITPDGSHELIEETVIT